MNLYGMQRPLGALYLVATALSCASASAQDSAIDRSLQPVEVQATRSPLPRMDVQNTCPGYGDVLKESLSRSLRYMDSAGEMKVVFELKGNSVDKVQTVGGPWEYRKPVRRAVRTIVSCVNDGQANQQYVFQVVFKPDDGTAERPQLAVIDGQTLAQKN